MAAAQICDVQIFGQIGIQRMMAADVVDLATFFQQPHPKPMAVAFDVFDLKSQRPPPMVCEGQRHECDQRQVPEAGSLGLDLTEPSDAGERDVVEELA